MASQVRAQRTPEERQELVRIIEEGIWSGGESGSPAPGVRERMLLHDDKCKLFLEEEILPALVPALQELLAAHLEKEKDIALGKSVNPVNAIDWLAQYLMRNNPRYSDRLATHPYVTLIKDHSKQVRAEMESKA
eukprot:Hpha_TRINITY_DN6263_c0_g1::TRINITY_DN6263_c0_g1_i1::g.23534::m.23534